MRYISPVRFFQYLTIPIDDISDVKTLRKMVNLEFVSSSTGIFEIDGFAYNKHDLLQLLADEDFAQNWQHHLAIWNNYILLELLECETIYIKDIQYLQDVSLYRNNPAFCVFVSPYFVEPFRNISGDLLADLRLADLSVFLKSQTYINKSDAEVAYKSLINYFEDALYIFRNINSSNWKHKLSEIKRWTNRDWALVLNQLPDYLYGYREQIAEYLTHLLLIMQYDDKTVCYSISSWLVELKIDSPEIAETILGNHLIYKNAFESAYLDDIPQKKKKHSLPLQKTAIYALLVITILFIFFMSRHKDDHSMYDPYTHTFHERFDTKEIKNDTLAISKDIVYNDLAYFDIATLYQKAYDGQKVESLDPIDGNEYGVLPVYFNIFDGQDKYLKPIEIKNNTNQNLVFVYFEQARIRGLVVPLKGSIYIEPLESKNISFFIDSLGVANDSSDNRTRLEYFLNMHKVVFAMNGAQSIAMSVNLPQTISYCNENFKYSLLISSIRPIQDNMTIEINKSDNKYGFSIKGKIFYFLTKNR